MREEEITFVIPTFGIEPSRMANLEFVLRKISEVSSNVLVVEQVSPMPCAAYISPAQTFAERCGARYLRVGIDDGRIHKSRLINEGVAACNTPYVWVNDADCYMKFAEVLPGLRLDSQFIQPYRLAKKATPAESDSVRAAQPTKITFDKLDAPRHMTSGASFGHVSLYSALCFVFRKQAFLKIGGMDERYTGWGFEDTDFCYRVLTDKRFRLRIDQHKAIHLYHNQPPDYKKESYAVSSEIFCEKFGMSRKEIISVIKESYSALEHTVGVIGIGRTGTSCLGSTISVSAGLRYCGEPFGTWGVDIAPHNRYRHLLDVGHDAYIKAVLSGEPFIKHLDYEVLQDESEARMAFQRQATLRMVKTRKVVVFTTRKNFLDWVVSQTVSREERRFRQAYAGLRHEVTKERFDQLYTVWSDWHGWRLLELIREREALGKTFHVLDYEQIADPEFLRDFVLKNIPGATAERFRIPTKKQKTRENRDYISNYDDVLLWYAQTQKQ